jgi:heme exporter protein C
MQNKMKLFSKRLSRAEKGLILSSIVLFLSWIYALFFVDSDVEQGHVYRILYIHVPLAWAAFLWVFASCFYAVLYLVSKKRSLAFDQKSHAAMEISVVLIFLVLLTGSIWGRATWGVWWDWEPRLTLSLILFFMTSSYILFRQFSDNLSSLRQYASILAITCAVNVPLVYFSVNLWRSLHQPQTFLRSSGQNASSDITSVLILCSISLIILSFFLYKVILQRIALSYAVTMLLKDQDHD